MCWHGLTLVVVAGGGGACKFVDLLIISCVVELLIALLYMLVYLVVFDISLFLGLLVGGMLLFVGGFCGWLFGLVCSVLVYWFLLFWLYGAAGVGCCLC